MKLNLTLPPCPFCTGIASGPERGVIVCSECGVLIEAANDESAATLWTARKGPPPRMPEVFAPHTPGENEQQLNTVTAIAMAIFPAYAMKRMFDQVKGESWNRGDGMATILDDAYEMAEAFVADAEARLRDARTADSLASPADTETKSG